MKSTSNRNAKNHKQDYYYSKKKYINKISYYNCNKKGYYANKYS